MEVLKKRQNIEFESKDNNAKKEPEEKIIREIGLDIEKSKTQTKLNIEGVEIYFPYEPYACQLEYMKKSIISNNI
jgi:hypothetical protein